LALGMLTKGPVAIVLVGGTIVLWHLVSGGWREMLGLAWVPGLSVFLAVTAPWYLLAERTTPGFLHYFFVQENFERYLSHDFGIRYGSTHQQPHGAIWLMLAGMCLPWTILLVSCAWRAPGKLWARIREDRWLSLAVSWGVTAPIFFTFARQILPTYIFPSVP